MLRRDMFTPVRRGGTFVAVVALLAACSSSKPAKTAEPTTTGAPSTTVARPDPTLPADCVESTPDVTAVLTFVAGGRAWAMNPDRLEAPTCLFPVADAGFFSWGPQGDRVVLAGLEVHGVGSEASRPAADLRPSHFSWSRPTGTTVVFTDQRQRTISRADMGSAGTRDITPLPDVKYADMAYHPSGLSIGFVATDADGLQSIWMATNQGKSPELLVQAQDSGTKFEHIVFRRDGFGLLYTVDQGDAHTVELYSLAVADVLHIASFDAAVVDVVETRSEFSVGFTVGATCAERRAYVQSIDSPGASVVPLGAGLPGPVSIVGQLDADRFVVASGGCGEPSDLYLVGARGAAPELLAKTVDAAAMRTPEPSPPPPLPGKLPRSGFA